MQPMGLHITVHVLLATCWVSTQAVVLLSLRIVAFNYILASTYLCLWGYATVVTRAVE